jgi:folylpolyglutamate synthase/dihydropteroate synthase
MKKLSKILLLSGALILGNTINTVAQQKGKTQNDPNNIVLTPYIPEQAEAIPEGAGQQGCPTLKRRTNKSQRQRSRVIHLPC